MGKPNTIIVVICAIGLLLTGCGTPAATEGNAAIVLPYTLLDTDDLQIVIDRQGDDLTFEAECKGPASFQEIAVYIGDPIQDEASPRSGGSARPATCTDEGQVVISGTKRVFDSTSADDQIEVSATISGDDDIVSTSRTFVIGQDGELYAANQ